MKRSLVALLGLLVVTSVANTLSAQAPARPAGPPPSGNGEVRGIVQDAKDTIPLGRASVALRNKANVIVAGAMATPNGAFRVVGLRPGTYSLRITAIGYSPKVQDVIITDAAPNVNMGTLRLARFAVALKGVEVVEDRATVAIEPDRNSYRAKDVAPAAANASEVLDATPSVAVDQDGKVSLRGNENVAVQINGRPSPITGIQLGAYLKSLPANIIDRVEVVPNPSAKYDPEGMAGIINIVLKSTVDLGYSGGANAGIANAQRYNASGNIGYQAGPLTSFLNLGFNNDDRDVTGINDRERLDALRAPMSFTNQDIATTAGNGGQNLNATVDYKLTPRDVLSNALTLSHRRSTDETISAYEELTGGHSLLDQYDRTKSTGATGLFFDYDVALKRTLEPRKHELSAEVRFNRAHDEDNTMLWRQSPAVLSISPSRLEGERQATDAYTKQFTAQTDYTRTLGARTKLETGYKANVRWLDRDYNVTKDLLGAGTWVPSSLSNGLSFDETVHAVYGVLSQGLGKFDLQAGLRGEQASRDFQLATTAQKYPYKYASIFPSGVVSYSFNDATQAKVSYSRRIRRPGSQELNPFPSFMDNQNAFVGNPQLNPEYTDALELGVTRSGSKGSLQLSPFYRHTSNVIRVIVNTADHIDGREVTSVSFSNLATSNSFGTDVNGSLRLGPKLNGFAGFNLFKVVTDGGSLSTLSSNAVTWAARVNGSTSITPTLIFQAAYQYRAGLKIERGEFAPVQNMNFSLRKKIDGDNSSVTLRVLDPFSTNRFRIKVGDDNVVQLTERTAGVRGVFITYQYLYGQTPRVRQVQQDQQSQGPGFP
ncbi:MAG: TonB-dependent receptor [Gemmatimonadetes bacterium]|nr:TonB-dependent receptor [Gemmatimonadota bacterium]